MSTRMRYIAGELLVPTIVLLGCLLYWLHVQDARSVARRVPDGVIAFTAAMTLIVLSRTLLLSRSVSMKSADDAGATITNRSDLVKRALFVLLCLGYYSAFSSLGFNLANLAFLLIAYPLAGLGFGWSVFGALASSFVFYGLAWLMEFNVPVGPLGF